MPLRPVAFCYFVCFALCFLIFEFCFTEAQQRPAQPVLFRVTRLFSFHFDNTLIFKYILLFCGYIEHIFNFEVSTHAVVCACLVG